MFDFKKITGGLGLARSSAGAKVGQPSQHHRPAPDANYILSDGLNAYDIGNGSSARMEPIAGRRYRILRRRIVDGHEVVEEVSQAAVLRTSTAADSDLILQLDGKTRITFQQFYAVCADDMCGIELPNSAGGRVVINATTPVQQAYTHGGGLVYSFGDPDTVLALTDSFSHWFGSSPIAHNVAEVASSASTMSSKLPLALLGIAAAGGGAAAFAGGGGGGGGGGVVPATEMVTIRGTVVAGPIIVDRILKVSFYKVDGTPLVENVLVLRDGSFSASFVKGYSGVIVAKLVDPDDQVDYRDEASNGYRDIRGDMRAVVTLGAGENTLILTISPLTELAARMLGLPAGDKGSSSVTAPGLTAEAVAAVDARIQAAFGLSVPITASAVAIVNADGSVNPSANSLGLVLASISGLEKLYDTVDAVSLIKAAFDGGNVDKAAALLVAGARTVDDARGTSVVAALKSTSASLAALYAKTAAVEATLANADAARLKALTLAEVASLSDAAVASLTATQVAQLTAEQISVLSPSALRHLDTSKLPATTLSALSLSQVKSTYEGDAATIGGAAQQAVLIDSIDQVSGHVASALAPGVTLGIYNNGVRVGTVNVAPDGSWALDATQFAAIGTYNLLVKAELPDGTSIPVTAPLVFQVKDVASLTPSDMPHVPASQILNLSDTAIQALTPEQMSSLSQEQVDLLLPTKLGVMTDAQITAIFSVRIAAGSNDAGATIANGGFTNDATPRLTGELHSAIPTGVGLKVVVYKLTQQQEEVVGTATVSGTTWSLELNDPLDAVENTFKVRIETLDGQRHGDWSDSYGFTVDLTPPQILSITPASTQLNLESRSTLLTLTFSEEVVGLTLDDLRVKDGNSIIAGGLSQLKVSSSDARVWTVRYTAEANIESASRTIELKTGSYTDRAGNAGSGRSSDPIATDTLPPTVTITPIGQTPEESVTAGDIVTYHLLFSEAVGSLSTANLLISGGTALSLNVDSSNPKLYVLKVEVGADASTAVLDVSLAGAPYKDLSGNVGAAASAIHVKVDNLAPTITTSSLTLAENATSAGALTATDATAVTWSLDGSGADDALFEIDGSQLKFKAAPNYESPLDTGGTAGDNIYVVKVKATDAAGNVATKDVTVSVTNVNEAPTAVSSVPAVTAVTGLSSWSFALSSYFADVDAGDTRSYSVVGAALPAGLTLNTATGVISGASTADFTDKVLTVRMTDSGGLHVDQSVTIRSVTAPSPQSLTVTDATGAPGVGTSGDTLTFTVSFAENVTVAGTPTLTFKVGGQDVVATYDSGTGTSALVFKGVAPATGDGTSVSISAGSGTVTGVTTGQRWVPTSSVTGAYTLDNTAPVIATSSLTIAENATSVGTLSATDATAVTWSLDGSGADDALFAVSSSGALSFKAAPNFENPLDTGGTAGDNVYVVKVKATDAVGHVTTKDVTVSVTNVNEAPTAVGTVPAVTAVTGQSAWSFALSSYFADVDAGDTRSYSVVGTALPTGLTLNAATGVISGASSADFAARTVTVRMTDSGGLHVDQTLSIRSVTAPSPQSFTVTDATGAAGVGTSGDALTFTVSFAENVTVTGMPTLTFKVGGQDVVATYDSGTGTSALVFKGVAPATGDGTSVSISAGSGTVTGVTTGQPWVTTSSVTAAYTLDNTAPTIATSSLTVAENGTSAGTLSATDATAVTWSLDGSGADDALFTVSSAGALSFKAAPNFENPLDTGGTAGDSIYVVKVKATDAVGHVTTKDVTVSVTNVNEAPTAVGTVPVVTAVTDQPAWSFALSSYFADVDAGDTRSYSVVGLTPLPAGLTLNTATGVISGASTTDFAARTLTIRMTDGGGLHVDQSVTIRSVTAPSPQSFTVTDATGAPGVGTSGDTLTFTVSFAENVTVAGMPTLTFKVGGQDVVATYDSGTGTSALVFKGVAPATGDGTSVSISAGSGTVTGVTTGQPWVTTSSVTAAYTLDNTAPTIATSSLTAAENGTSAGTLSATDATAVTWSLDGSGADDALFTVSSAGALSFKAAPNFESPLDTGGTAGDNVYVVKVKATDAVGHVTTKDVTVSVTNVNEAPTIAHALEDKTAVIGNAFSYDFGANAFVDPDGTSLTYSALLSNGSALPSWLSFNAAQHRFEALNVPASASSITVRVTASDGALTVTDDFIINPLAAPTLTTTLGGVTNFDVRSGIVIKVGQDILASSGGTITLTDLGGPGFYENEWYPYGNAVAPTAAQMVHTQVIDVTDTSKVKIVGTGADTRIIIYPEYQLDLASNYSMAISDGAFHSSSTGLASNAFQTINFSTVTPNHLDHGGLASGTLSQIMNETTGAMQTGLKWVDFTGPNGQNIGGDVPVVIDLSSGDYVLAIKDVSSYVKKPVDRDFKLIDTYVKFVNFGADDLIYVDNQLNTAKNWRRIDGSFYDGHQVGPNDPNYDQLMDDYGYALYVDYMFPQGLGSAGDPFIAGFQGTDLASEIRVVMDPSIQLPLGYANVPEYNHYWQTSQIFNIIANGWSHTGMAMSA